MLLSKVSDTQWKATGRNGADAAILLLDHGYQLVDLLVITRDPAEIRALKELAANHVTHYVRNRTRSFGVVLEMHVGNGDLTIHDSEALMSFADIAPEIAGADDAALDRTLAGQVNVRIIGFQGPNEMLSQAARRVAEATGVEVTFRSMATTLPSSIEVVFQSDTPFQFWHRALSAGEDADPEHLLHIVPPYYPSLAGKRQGVMVNGDTCAFIGKRGCVEEVLPPPEAQAAMSILRTWSQMRHPFLAESDSLTVRLSLLGCFEEGADDAIVELLVDALGLGDTYAVISGGFSPPLPYPSNLTRKKVLGCEHSCVWEHRTLEAEGKLDGAIIPTFFLEGGWLDIYRGIGTSPSYT